MDSSLFKLHYHVDTYITIFKLILNDKKFAEKLGFGE